MPALSHSDPATGLPVGPRAARLTDGEGATSEALLGAVLASLDDDKAEDVVRIDLRGRSDMADDMVVASGRSSRQVASISEKLADRVKAQFGLVCRMEGKDTGDWVLIDAGDVIVHVFRPEVREFYQLEKMWQPGGHMDGGAVRPSDDGAGGHDAFDGGHATSAWTSDARSGDDGEDV